MSLELTVSKPARPEGREEARALRGVPHPAEADSSVPSFPARPAETSVPILEALANRWSPYRFATDKDVSESDLRAILEAARWAPSSYGEEPWRFIVARRNDEHRRAMDQILYGGNSYARRASVLIASLARTTFTRNEKPNRVAMHDVGLATANLLAEATARGLITHPMGGFDKEALRTTFRVPEVFSPVAIVAVGHHDATLSEERLLERERRPRRRRPLHEIVFGASFGSPAGF